MDPLAASLARSPELFPLDFGPATDQVTLVRLTEFDYRAASFLDTRIVLPQTLRRAVPWDQLEAAVGQSDLQESSGYIFHIGHVGSTLLSRLLGAHSDVFALREPAILRTFARMRSQLGAWNAAEFDRRLGMVLRLLSRTFRPGQRAIVKATSFVSELAPKILLRSSRPRAIFMYVPAKTYLGTILGAPNSPKEARFLAESRLTRVSMRIGGEPWRLRELSEGEMVAMSWACEMTALAAAAEQGGARTMWLNFDRFLEEPGASLLSAFHHFGVIAGEADIESILGGPELQRYAKAPEHAYSPALRRQILEYACRDQASEIARGLAWLDQAAARSPAIASLLNLR